MHARHVSADLLATATQVLGNGVASVLHHRQTGRRLQQTSVNVTVSPGGTAYQVGTFSVNTAAYVAAKAIDTSPTGSCTITNPVASPYW